MYCSAIMGGIFSLQVVYWIFGYYFIGCLGTSSQGHFLSITVNTRWNQQSLSCLLSGLRRTGSNKHV